MEQYDEDKESVSHPTHYAGSESTQVKGQSVKYKYNAPYHHKRVGKIHHKVRIYESIQV
jgi:hypothetical protein